MTPRDWFRSRFGCAALMGIAVVFAVVLVFRFHNPALAVLVLVIVGLARVLGSWHRAPLKIMMSSGAIGWSHTERGPGMIVWRDVGALIVREAGSRGEMAVYLVPRDTGAGGRAESFMMTTGDLGVPPAEGEGKLRGFVESILPLLPGDVVIDRETRRRLEGWGLRAPAGGGRGVA